MYPRQLHPLPNFQVYRDVQVRGVPKPQPLGNYKAVQHVGGFTFAAPRSPHVQAIQAALMTVHVTGAAGKPARFVPWFGALAHAIFFHVGTLDYFHTHVCGPGASGCTSVLGATKVTGTSATPGKLTVGVLVPVPGTWRLFLQCQVGRHVITAPLTLRVR